MSIINIADRRPTPKPSQLEKDVDSFTEHIRYVLNYHEKQVAGPVMARVLATFVGRVVEEMSAKVNKEQLLNNCVNDMLAFINVDEKTYTQD